MAVSLQVQEFCHQLGENYRALTEIDLRGTKVQVGDVDVVALAQAVTVTSMTLDRLDLGKNKISIVSCVALGKAMKTNPTALKGLDLSDNNIGDEGAKAVARALTVNGTLEKLQLTNCQIGVAGAFSLAESLSNNIATALWELDLSGNEIGDEGCKAISKALKFNGTVERLKFVNCQIGDIGVVALAGVLASNTTALKYLNLSSNEIGDEGATTLADGLNSNDKLQELWIFRSKVGQAGAEAFLLTLQQHNCTLEQLGLGLDYGISRSTKEQIDELLDQNQFCIRNPVPTPLIPTDPALTSDDIDAAITEQQSCPLCLEPLFDEGKVLGSCVPCGHVFHKMEPCFEAWERTSLAKNQADGVKCPTCMEPVPQFIRLFLDPLPRQA